MTQQFSIAEAQAVCLRNNIPFYTYRLPGAEEVVFGAQLSDHPTLFKGFEYHRGEEGFVIAPFNPSSWSFPYIIRPDLKFVDRLTDGPAIVNLENTVFNTPERKFTSQDWGRLEFVDKARSLMSLLEQEGIRTATLSRTITIPCDSILVAPSLFRQMLQYRHAFVFFAAIPGKCAWMGASPEPFLRYDREGFRTSLLSGARAVSAGEGAGEWSEEETREQELLAGCVAETLRPFFRRNLERGDTTTVRAGNMLHLCTCFQSDEQLSADQIDMLVRTLHPSPAECGVPKKRTMQAIVETEEQDRKYYTGYLGPLQVSGGFDLFVNIRSMEVFDDAVKLFVGCELTPDSDPENKWQETNEKANTMLNLIRQIRYGKTNF